MKKLKIAIDFDDVIVPTAPHIIGHYNKTYNTSVTLKDFYSTDLAAWETPDHATAVSRVETYLRTNDDYQTTQPFPGAIEFVNMLGKDHELHVVTGRPDFLAKVTEDILTQHFPGVFRSVEFTNFFGKTSRSKAEVCRELGIDVFVDDHLHHASVVADYGIDVLLFGDYPWNQSDSLPTNVRRVRDWPHIAQLLLPNNKKLAKNASVI